MADKTIMVDTSILIDYYRRTDKNNSVWISLVKQGYEFSISAITKYEIFAGATQDQLEFWNNVLETITVIPFDEPTVDRAVEINIALKRKRKQIALADLFIAATAISHKLSFATLNRKHFDRIDELDIIE
ncbi:MAG: type II toxin-antitoxin system VapC family toxin [Ferruginibacter sp.]